MPGLLEFFRVDRAPIALTASQWLEDLLGEHVSRAIDARTKIEESHQIDALFAHFQEFIHCHIPAGDRLDGLHQLVRVVQLPPGPEDELADVERIQAGVEALGDESITGHIFIQGELGLRLLQPQLSRPVGVEVVCRIVFGRLMIGSEWVDGVDQAQPGF